MFLLRDAVFLIELAFYCPLIPAAIFILLVHGVKKPYTWRPIIIPLFILSGIRIAGAALGLAAMSPGKSGLLTTATLLDTIGLAPLMCLLVGLLARANAPVYKGFPFWAFLPLQLTVVVATVLTAYGGRDLYSAAQNQSRDIKFMRAGTFIFISIFTITVVLAMLTLLKVSRGHSNHRTERAATVCMLLCVPFMTIRLAFSVGSLFTTSAGGASVLNPMSEDNTDIWVHFFMVIVMEYVAALSATAVALTAKQRVVLEGGKDHLFEESEDEDQAPDRD